MEIGIIYDCDGTLIESEHIAGSVCAEALTRIGFPMTMEAFNSRFNGIPATETWEILRKEIPFPLPEGFNAAINAEIYRRFDTELEAVEGAREAVLAIGGPRAVASSTRLDRLRLNLQNAGLSRLFGEHVYSASQVRRGKPAPDVFLFAASQIGADPDHTIVIEDSVAGVTAARRAGMNVLGFVGSKSGGADLSGPLKEAGARRVASHMRELPGLVEDLRSRIANRRTGSALDRTFIPLP